MLLLMSFGRGVRVVRGWGILALGDEGVWEGLTIIAYC
jgi:hypothetical protein